MNLKTNISSSKTPTQFKMNLRIYNVLFTIFTLTLGSSLQAQDWVKDTCTLKGNVASYDYKIKAYYGSKEPEVVQNERYEYNKQGYLVRSTLDHVSFMGHADNETVRIYDKEGIHCLREFNLMDKDTLSPYNFLFDNFGKLQQVEVGTLGQPWCNHYYKYNNQGLLSEVTIKIHKTGDVQTQHYEYDENKRMIAYSDVSERHSQHFFQKYDENGKLIEKKLLDTSRTSKTYYEVDDNGEITDEKHFDYSNAPNTDDSYIERYIYNELGQVIEETTTDLEGNITYKYSYTYNKHGDLKASTTFSAKNNETYKYTYTYKYDEQGNWIEKISLCDGELDEEEKRIIQYY